MIPGNEVPFGLFLGKKGLCHISEGNRMVTGSLNNQ